VSSGGALHVVHTRGLAEYAHEYERRGMVRSRRRGGQRRERRAARAGLRAGAEATERAPAHGLLEAARGRARRVLIRRVPLPEVSREVEPAAETRAVAVVHAPAGRVVSRETLSTCLRSRRGGREGDGRVGEGGEDGGRESVSSSRFAAGGKGASAMERGEGRSSWNMRCLCAC
jgi:hypothetical protein